MMKKVLLVALLGKSDRVERELNDVRCKREEGRRQVRIKKLLKSLVVSKIIPIFVA